MGVEIRKPTDRVCERCGRHEEWTAEADAWTVATEDGDPKSGSVFCLHEWDINGAFIPVEESDPAGV